MSESKLVAVVTEVKTLTAAEILSAPDVQTEEVPCPEWGKPILIRGLRAFEAAEFLALNKENRGDASAYMFIMSVINPDGSQAFSVADLEVIKKKSLSVVNRVQRAAMRLNGIGQDKEMEAAKNASGEAVR